MEVELKSAYASLYVSDDSSFFSVYFDPPLLHPWLPNSVACILVLPEDRTLAGDGVDSIEKYYKSLWN